MPLDGLLQLLLLDADVALCHGGGRVLQELLDKGDIVPAILVNLRGIKISSFVLAPNPNLPRSKNELSAADSEKP